MSDRPRLLFETSLPVRYYIPRIDVRSEFFTASDTRTSCPYKGTASYWTATVEGTVVADVAWSYEDPFPESLPLRSLLSFEPQRATLTTDLPGER